MRIIGVDPGLHRTGWGIIEKDGSRLRYVACGVVTSVVSDPLPERLLQLHQGLEKVLAEFQPVHCALEETFINVNAASSLKLGHARGALMVTIALSGILISEYAATLVKKTLVGVGRAEKHQVATMVKHLLPGCNVASTDATDALAAAICHASHPMR